MFRAYSLLVGSISLLAIGFSSPEKTTPKSQQLDEYAKAVVQYYEAIAAKEYSKAYNMLGQCEIRLFNADGSGVSFHRRQDYKTWLERQKNIESLAVLKVVRFQFSDSLSYTADKGNAEATLGIRIYVVRVNIKLREEAPGQFSGREKLFVSVVKGNDSKIRILGIGTGP